MDRKLLKFNANEQKVLLALKSFKLSDSVTHIASEADLPRTTVTYTLWSLLRRGLAERIRVKNHWEWQLKASSKNELEKGSTEWKNEDNILEVARHMARLSNGERVYAIQGTISAALGLKKISKDFLGKFHAALKDKKIIISGIIGKKTVASFEGLSKDALASHYGRLVVVHVVPDEYLDNDCDIYVVRNTVFVLHYKDLSIRMITDPEFALLQKNLIQFMQLHAEKVDLNAYIRPLM
jgi:hypothetical protein